MQKAHKKWKEDINQEKMRASEENNLETTITAYRYQWSEFGSVATIFLII